MSYLKIFNQFKPVNYLQSFFSRQDEQEMWDTNTHGGSLKPFQCPEELCANTPQYESLYPLDQCECLGLNDVSGGVHGFDNQQHFLLSGGNLVVSSETSLCAGVIDQLAGAPSPEKPSFTTPTCDESWCGVQGLSYVVTNVSVHLGITTESSPSLTADPKQIHAEIPNTIITLPTVDAGYGIVSQRIYRVEVSFKDGATDFPMEGAEWVFVAEVPAGTATFNDTLTTHETGYPLTTYAPEIFVAPDSLIGITRTEDGLAVADTHRVYISMAGQAMFSYEGVVQIEDTIRAIRSIGNNIFVLTNRNPVFITFTHGKAMIDVKRQTIQRDLPVTSLKSISVYGSRVFFASTYSLMVWDTSGYGADIKSAVNHVINPEQWLMVAPDSVVGVAFEFGYLLTSTPLGLSLLIELTGHGVDTRVSGSVMPIRFIKATVMNRLYSGHIVYQEDDKIFKWDFRTPPTCIPNIQQSETRSMCLTGCPYKVKFYIDSDGKSMPRVVRIEWDERTSGSLQCSFYRESFGVATLVDTMTVLSSRAFNTPKFQAAQTHSIVIEGLGTVTEVRLAAAFADLIVRPKNGNQNEQ